MRLRTICLCLFAFCPLLLTGCWDKTELNDVSIATGIAVDPGEEHKYKLTVEVVNSSQFAKQGAEGNAPVTTFSVEGESLSELSDKLNLGLVRKVIYSHTRVVYINQEIAKEGILGFLDFLERSGHFRNDFNILVTTGKAADFTRVTYPVQKIPSLKIHQQIKTLVQEWGGDPDVRLNDFIDAIISKGREPVAAIVIIKGDPEKGKSTENNKMMEPDALVSVDGMAVFDDEKMIGTMSLDDVRNYLWTQSLPHTSLTIPCDEEENRRYMDVRIIRSKSKMTTSYEKGQATLKVNIYGEARLQGAECKHDLSKLDVFQDYEKKLMDHIKSEVTQSIVKVQDEFGLDIYGFGDALNRENSKQFKEVEDNWNKVFTDATVEVDVAMQMLRTGIKSKSFMSELPDEESKEE
ncbi:Ger(x)C family spore germination protein [Metabacillus sp. HB246100]